MRKKIIVGVMAGALAVSGAALAAPALAEVGTQAADATTPDGRPDRIAEALAGLVSDGTLTQDQADAVAAALPTAGPGGRGGPGGPSLGAAATALGITTDELRTALGGDRTLAQVAQDRGVPLQTLIDALVAAEQTRIAEAVAEGRLTQEEADERLADLPGRVAERVNTSRPAPRQAERPSPADDAQPGG